MRFIPHSSRTVEKTETMFHTINRTGIYCLIAENVDVEVGNKSYTGPYLSPGFTRSHTFLGGDQWLALFLGHCIKVVSGLFVQVQYYTKGCGAYDNDLAVTLRVNRIRIVALYLFVPQILNYIQQLHVERPDTEGFEPEDEMPVEESTTSVQVRFHITHNPHYEKTCFLLEPCHQIWSTENEDRHVSSST